MRIRSTVAAHPVAFGSILLVVAAVATFVLLYFEPQKLFIDDRVSEPLPTVAAAAGGDGAGRSGGRARPQIETVARGGFQSYEHSTSGEARVLRLTDGSRFLRFEGFETSNGPDVRVYLSAAPVAAGGTFPDPRLTDHAGNERRLSQLVGGDPTVLHFYRSRGQPAAASSASLSR